MGSIENYGRRGADEVSDIFLSGSENPQMSCQYDISDILGSKCAEIFEKIRHFGRRGREKRNVEKYDISDILQAKSEVSNVEKYDISDILQAKSEVSNVE